MANEHLRIVKSFYYEKKKIENKPKKRSVWRDFSPFFSFAFVGTFLGCERMQVFYIMECLNFVSNHFISFTIAEHVPNHFAHPNFTLQI